MFSNLPDNIQKKFNALISNLSLYYRMQIAEELLRDIILTGINTEDENAVKKVENEVSRIINKLSK